MIYLDSALVAKCYLDEPGASAVRALASRTQGMASCQFARLEFACVLQRHQREGRLSAKACSEAWSDFAHDESNGVWHWLRVSPRLIQRACAWTRRTEPTVFLRAGDALHLACAAAHGFDAVYSNDFHMLAAAPHFHLRGINPLADS